MNEVVRQQKGAVASSLGKSAGKQPASVKKTPSHSRILPGNTQAHRLAIVVLEVLAGGCTPAEAAQRLNISLPRYYQLESRAVEGLVRGCQPLPMGKQPAPAARIAALEKQVQRLQQECARQQALVRTTQRSLAVVLPAKPAKPVAKPKSKKAKRRPTVRAWKAAATLQNRVAQEQVAEVQQELPPSDSSMESAVVTSDMTPSL
jgi:hypothetical protein